MYMVYIHYCVFEYLFLCKCTDVQGVLRDSVPRLCTANEEGIHRATRSECYLLLM